MGSVVVAGHVNWDVTLRVDALPEPDAEACIRERTGGGSAGNVAIALAELGVSVGVIGSVGDDDRGAAVKREFDAAGVDCSRLRSISDGATTVKYVAVAPDGQLMIFGQRGVNEALAPADVDADYVAAADHLHLTSQRPETARELAAAASETGVPVSFDPGRRYGEREFAETFARADYVFLNGPEADRCAADLPGDPVLVVTRGAAGARVETADDSYDHPGFEIEAVDATGAGAAFAAGFLAARRDGADYRDALAFANACGALASTTVGARAAPSRAAVHDFLAEREGSDA